MWDAATGEPLRTLSGHTASVWSAAYSPDGRTIVTASGEGTDRVWDADYHDFIGYACARVWRDFTPDERARYGIDNLPTCDKFAVTPMPYPTMPPVRETWTPFPLPDTPELLFIPSYTPGPSPTRISPSNTPTPRPTKSPTATATIIISTLARTLSVWTPIASLTASEAPPR